MVDLNAQLQYKNLNEALKAVYNPNYYNDMPLSEMAGLGIENRASNKEKKAFVDAVKEILEKYFANLQQGVTQQFQKEKAFIYKKYDGGKLHIFKPLDIEGKQTSLPGGDSKNPLVNAVTAAKVRNVIHLFFENLEEKIENVKGDKFVEGYELVAKDCLLNKQTCVPKNWAINLNSQDSYDHFFVPKRALMTDENDEPTSTGKGETNIGGGRRTAGIIRLKNVLSQAEIQLDFRQITNIEFISPVS